MTDSPTRLSQVPSDRMTNAIWACSGASSAWTVYSGIMVFVLGHYEHMLGGPSVTFFFMLVGLLIANPTVGFTVFYVQGFLRPAIREHQVRMRGLFFAAGVMTVACFLALASLAPSDSLELLNAICRAAFLAAVVTWCTIAAAGKCGFVCHALPNLCANCGYDLRGTPRTGSACPECGATR